MRNKTFKAVAVSTVLVAVLAGCSNGSTPQGNETPTTPAVTQTDEPTEKPEATETAEPTEKPETEKPEAEEVKVNVRKLKVGDKVPASQVDEAKKAGVNVYRTLDGTGEVVKKGTLTDTMKKEYKEVMKDPSIGQGSRADKQGAEAREAGVSMVSVYHIAGNDYMITVLINGVPNMNETQATYGGKDAAIAKAKSLAKKHGVEFFLM